MVALILERMSDAGQALKARLDDLRIKQTQFAARLGKHSSWTSAQLLPNAESTLLHLAFKEPETFRGWVFASAVGTPLNPHNLLRDYKKLCDDNKLPAFRLHDLRHTFTSRAVNAIGVKATSKILGHAKVQQTLDTYTHITDEELKEAVLSMEALSVEAPKVKSKKPRRK